MIAKHPHTYAYRCWKCKRTHLVEQQTTEERKDLKCPQCKRTLFRVERGPNLNTDTEFMSGSHVDDGFGNCQWMRKRAHAKAKAAGVNVNGARYCPQLCPRGESLSPKAWVHGKDDVKRRVKELGLGCQGAVNVPSPNGDA